MSTPLPRNLVLDRNIGWHQEVFVTPEKNEVNPFLDQKSIAPDYDWSKLMPPSEQGLEFKPQYFLIVVYPLRDYVLTNHWHDIQCAAEDNGFGIALKVGQNIDLFYITMATLPSSAKDPWAFRKAIRFCELLATTNVPPSVAIQILNGDLGHKYLPIGRQQGGLCLKHDIPQATFLERYGRFFYFIKDRLVSYGVSLYLTGNTITVVGKPQLELVMEKVIAYAKLCIIDNEVHLKKKLNKKKGNKKKEGRKKKGSKNEEALPLSSATQDEREQEERKQDEREQEEKGNKVDLGLETETTMLKPSMEVDLGLETETTMPKWSRYEPFLVFERPTTMPKVLRDQHRVVFADFVGWEVKIIPRKNNKPDPVVDLGLESETVMSKTFMVDIGFDTETTTMPKASRERPRVLIDKYVGWGLEVLGPTSNELSSRPETDVVHLEDISPEYNWSKLMPPTKLVRGKLVVEPGWEFKPQFFRVWVNPLREYLLTTEWSDIEVAAADNGFGIVFNKGLKRWYIFAAVGPEDPKDPWAFPKAIRFCELLATTNVPPSVAIDILYGQLGHKFLPIGCQPGGLCLKHGIPQDTFLERYYRFISQTKDIVDTLSGVSLYLTGNTISVVGKPELDLVLDMVAIYAGSCILLDEKSANLPEDVKAGFDFMNKQMEAFSQEGPLKKKRSKKNLSNDEEPLEKKLRNEEALSQEPLKKKLSNEKRLCCKKNLSRRK